MISVVRPTATCSSWLWMARPSPNRGRRSLRRNQDGRILEQGAGDGDALLSPPDNFRPRSPTGFVFERQRLDEIVQLGSACRC